MNANDTVTGTIESITPVYGQLKIKLVGDDKFYLMLPVVTATLHRRQDHHMTVMAAEFVSHPDDPEANPNRRE